MSLKLPVDVYSPDQLAIVLWELGAMIATQQNAATRQKISKEPTAAHEQHISAFLLSVLDAQGIDKTDLVALNTLQTELTMMRDRAPVAHMILPALPNRTLKRKLVDWFRTEIDPSILMTFAVRSDIGGGFVLRVGSKHRDFTFRRQLLDNKHRIAEIYDGVR